MRRSRLKIFLLYFAPQFSVYTKFGIDPTKAPFAFFVMVIGFLVQLADCAGSKPNA